jgi:DNA-binding transcriptional regulator WhiA
MYILEVFIKWLNKRQTKEINALLSAKVKLAPALLEACELRLANPDTSLSALAEISGISKSALNKRFIKIHEAFVDLEGRNL